MGEADRSATEPERRRAPRLHAVALALLLMVPVLLWLWSGTDAAPAAPAPPPIPATPDPPPTAASTAPEPPPAAAARHDVPVPAAIVEADLDHPFAYRLDVHVVDADSLPVVDALVFAAPPDCGFALWPEATDATGRVQLQWRARRDTMELRLLVLAFGLLQPLRSLQLRADRPATATFATPERPQQEDDLRRMLRRDQKARSPTPATPPQPRPRQTRSGEVECGRTLLLFREFDCGNCHEPSRIAAYATLARAREARTTLHPHAVFGDLGLAPDDELARRRTALEQRSRDALGLRLRGPRVVVSGVVVDADGKPANQRTVAWLDHGALRGRTVTDERGRYRLDAVAGAFDLCAGGGDGGIAHERLVAQPGELLTWNAALQRQQYVLGRTLGETGSGLLGWRVEWLGDDGGSDVARTRANGFFELGPVGGPGRCLLWPEDASLRLPVRRSMVVDPGTGGLELRLDDLEPARSHLRLRPQLPAGHAGLPVDIRIWQYDTGRGAWLQHTGQDERFELRGLAAGWYSVEVGAPVLGWAAARAVCLDGRSLTDLGNVLLPAPGRVRLLLQGEEPAPFARPHAFLRRTAVCDVVEPAPEADGVATIPAGEHVVVWQWQGLAHAVAFAVEPGQLVTVTLPAQ